MDSAIFVPVEQPITTAAALPKAKDLFYRCDKCTDMIMSAPSQDVRCSCGNISINLEKRRTNVRDLTNITVLRQL